MLLYKCCSLHNILVAHFIVDTNPNELLSLRSRFTIAYIHILAMANPNFLSGNLNLASNLAFCALLSPEVIPSSGRGLTLSWLMTVLSSDNLISSLQRLKGEILKIIFIGILRPYFFSQISLTPPLYLMYNIINSAMSFLITKIIYDNKIQF